jgi:hypothetical protein
MNQRILLNCLVPLFPYKSQLRMILPGRNICALFVLMGLPIFSIWPTNSFGQIGCDPAPSGLVSWWPAEGNANDIIGGNNGTLENGVTFAPGEVGQAFSFNGNGQSVVIPDSPSLDLTSTFTIEAWVNLATLTDDPNGSGRGIVSKVGNNTGLYGYQFGIAVGAGVLRGQFDSPGANWYGGPGNWIIQSPIPLVTGVWMHVAWTYDQNAMMLYLNGEPLATNVIGPQPIATSAANLRISGDDNLNVMFDGLIDEVSIYNRALCSIEIAAIYQAGSAGKCRISPTNEVITWANPAPITYGTALTSNQLDATANVCGTFAYTPTNGTVLNPGTNTLTVVFTPTDTVDYSTMTDSVSLVVLAPQPIINIQKAVYLTSTNLLTGLNYQVQASSDLINWTNQGSVFTATDSNWQSTNYWNVNDWNQLFFQLVTSP